VINFPKQDQLVGLCTWRSSIHEVVLGLETSIGFYLVIDVADNLGTI
jgi:hypothetical protein